MNSLARYIKTLVLALATLALCYCADQEMIEPEFGNCSNSPYIGSNLQLDLSDKAVVESGYFGKRVHLKTIQSAFAASSRSIADSLQFSGVKVFKIPDPSDNSGCRYHSYLPTASDFARRKWQQHSVTVQKGDVKLLGLFSTIYSRENHSGRVSLMEPMIVVRENTQKWTMIHEMTHYLFAKVRSQQKAMVFDRELQQQLREKTASIQRLQREHQLQPSKRVARRLAQAFADFFKINHQIDRRGPLEEFAIESMLSRASASGQMANVDNNLFQQYSLNYMLSNAAIVSGSYRIFLGKVENQKAAFQIAANQSATKELSDLQKNVQNTIDFMEEQLVNSPYWATASAFGQASPLPLEFDPFLQHFDINGYRERRALLESL